MKPNAAVITACGLILACTAVAAFGEEHLAGPYLQSLTQTGVLVRWVTDEPGLGSVSYGQDGKLTLSAKEKPSATPAPAAASVATQPSTQPVGVVHEVLLEKLRPGTKYDYSVTIAGKPFSGSFRTAPAGRADFSFGVWGDNRTFPRKHLAVASGMAKMNFDFAVSTGDIASKGDADATYFKEFFTPAADLLRDTPFFVAVGNHEKNQDPTFSRYKKFIARPNEQLYYAFTYADCRFVMLDSNDKGLYEGRQLEWLKREMASSDFKDARLRFLVLHHAPYCTDWYGGDKKAQQVIVPLAEENKVDVLLGGHFHCYERGQKDLGGRTMYYVVTGGGGGEFTSPPGYKPGNNKIEFMKVHHWKYHFMDFEVKGDKLLAKAIDPDGQVIDSFELPPAKGAPAAGPAATSQAVLP